MRRALLLLVVILPVSTSAAAGAIGTTSTQSNSSRSLTVDDRIAAQRAIEEVYWRHRIWPKDNPAPKPSLDSLMPASTLHAKVEDYLKKSNALESWWHRPITGEQLQAELDRMAKGSHDPKLLQELFDALHGDPFLVAETLARPVLVERLTRNWFASDRRIHGATRVKAETALAACRDVSCMKDMDGIYGESTFRLRHDDDARGSIAVNDTSITLDAEQWEKRIERLASVQTRRFGGLEETADAFVVTTVLARRDDEIVTATTSWQKQPFDAWWKVERAKQGTQVNSSAGMIRLPVLDPETCANDTWSATFTDLPEPRNMHTAVWTGTEMIVWGGYGDYIELNTGGRYNPATDTWAGTSIGAGAPLARYAHAAVWTGTEMIVWGGWTSQAGGSTHLNDGARYDPVSDTWTPTPTGVGSPAGRAYHTAVWTGTEMIIWGGAWDDPQRIAGARYNPSTNTWTPTSTGANVPDGRSGYTAIWTGTEMIVWGGVLDSTPTITNTGGRYDPVTDTWTATPTGPNVPSARTQHSAVWTGSEMIIWGGSDYAMTDPTQIFNSGGRYNPATGSWSATSTGAGVASPRYGHYAFWTGSKMIVWGGTDSLSLDTGAIYDPIAESWVATAASTSGPRPLSTAIWTGTEMIVWGGQGGVNSGSRFNPVSNSWVATSVASNAPEGRYGHTAVWTGAEMMVWGGIPGSEYNPDYDHLPIVNNGARYSPATDSWVPTSMIGDIPAPRRDHTAVWTGREMIVLGGTDGVALKNSGGRYDPLTDTWAATSTGENVPAPLASHTAVWTGTQMIVWAASGVGGRYDPATDTWMTMSSGSVGGDHTAVWTGTTLIVWGYLGGARYDPSTDAWTAISNAANAPLHRGEHTAVWTGTEMIVWGGYVTNVGYSNTGARYDPVADTWTPTSTDTNVATPRSYHTANWTGSEMIVWGGSVPNAPAPNSGGRYDPATDTWLPISAGANFPSFRYYHTAVWTGSELIVWGGTPYSVTGGRYCACPAGRLVYRDADGDGFGDPGVSIASCDGSTPAGYVLDHTDCNDAIANTSADIDNDGESDACDLNDGLIYEWRNDKTSLSWQAEQGPTSWNVYIGDLDVLRATGEYTQVPVSNELAGRQCGLTGSVAVEIGTPAPGKGSYSLVTGVTNGVEGSLGSSSSGPRANTNSCP